LCVWGGGRGGDNTIVNKEKRSKCESCFEELSEDMMWKCVDGMWLAATLLMHVVA
jgi:hypothetical protein